MEEPGELSDAALLARAAAEPQLFAVFYDRHVDAVAGFLHRRTGCPQTTLDLTAETFAAAYLHRRRYDGARAPARAWLIGIARRQLGTFVRRQRVVDKYTRRLGIPREEYGADDLERVEAAADFAATRNVMLDDSASQARLSHASLSGSRAPATTAGASVAERTDRQSLSRLADLLEER